MFENLLRLSCDLIINLVANCIVCVYIGRVTSNSKTF
jgi:hypothetical protein